MSSRISSAIQVTFAIYMAIAAAVAAIILGLTVADQISEKMSHMTTISSEIHPWFGFVILIIFLILFGGIVLVVITEIITIYQKWMTWADKVISRITRKSAGE